MGLVCLRRNSAALGRNCSRERLMCLRRNSSTLRRNCPCHRTLCLRRNSAALGRDCSCERLVCLRRNSAALGRNCPCERLVCLWRNSAALGRDCSRERLVCLWRNCPCHRTLCLRRSVGIWRDIGHRRNGCRCLFPCALRRNGGRCGLRFRLGFCGRCSLRHGLGCICGGIRHRFCCGCRCCTVHRGSLCKGFLLLLHLEISPFQKRAAFSAAYRRNAARYFRKKRGAFSSDIIVLAAEVGVFPRIPVRSAAA